MTDEALGLPPDEGDGKTAQFEGMSDEELLDHLVELDKLQYEQARKLAAKKLGISRVKELDDIVNKLRESKKQVVQAVEADIEELAASADEIIECDDILGLFDADWSRLIAGERRNGRLLLLAGTSRLLSKPMHIAVKGSSSGGKSEVRKTALNFFPPESVISFTTLSEKALLYEERDFQHMILSMGEAAGADEQRSAAWT